MPADAAALSIFNALFSSIADEMGAALVRSALSPNIRERRDISCAVFDAAGHMVAQASHIPVHLGAMPASVEAVQCLAPFKPGDVLLLNDPYLGGSHLPDVTMVSPVFSLGARRRLLGYVASRAHQSDIGGMSPGSMPLATELIQEGLDHPSGASLRRRRAQSGRPRPRAAQCPHTRRTPWRLRCPARRPAHRCPAFRGAGCPLRTAVAAPEDDRAAGVRRAPDARSPAQPAGRRVRV